MASRIEIENWALLYLEEDTETDINDSSAGQTIDLLYDSVFRQLLKKNTYGWTFARKIIQLGQISNPPELSDYSNAYQLPTDYLLMLRALQSVNTFVIVGTFVYSNDNTFQILYISQVDETLVTDEFAHALAYDLAYRAAGRISGKESIKQDLAYKYAMALRGAIQLDIAQMDTQQYMPLVNPMYQAFFSSGYPMGAFSGMGSISKSGGGN